MEKRLKRRLKGRFCVITALVAVIICALLYIGWASPLAENSGNSTVVSPTAAATLNTTYSALFHGSSYTYTDKDKVEGYRTGTLASDTSMVVVDSTEEHGSQKNPYVIESTSQWNAFAADMTAKNNYGKDKYFILTKDLDFNGVTFSQVAQFNGTFYGLGHKISNANLDGDNKESGLFGYATDAVLTDISNQNFNWTNVMYNCGGILGDARGGYVLNCHASGNFVRASTFTSSGTQQVIIGGVVGGNYGEVTNQPNQPIKEIVIYRCSANINADICHLPVEKISGDMCGGVLGQIWHNSGASILDCYAELNVSSWKNYMVYVAGLLGLVSTTPFVRMENNTAKVFANTSGQTAEFVTQLCGLFIESGATSYGIFDVTAKNNFTQVELNRDGTNYTAYPFMTWTSSLSRINSTTTFTLSNCQYAGNYAMVTKKDSNHDYSISTGKGTKVASVTDLWNNAKDATSPLSSDIWDKSKINTTYAIDDTPVINKLVKEQFEIEFYNHKTSGDENLGATVKYDYGTSIPLSDPMPEDTNHVFVGWTTDKNDEITPFKILPDNVYGNIKLYAVWDNPNTVADMTLLNSKTGDATSTLEYGTGKITLNATATGMGMPSPSVTYKWFKDSDTSKAVKTGSTCVLTDVKQSGTYSAEFTVRDSIEPLWRHIEVMGVTKDVTITKGQLGAIKIVLDDTAYYGQDIIEVTFTATATNSAGVAIDLKPNSASWTDGTAKVKNKGANTDDVTVRPQDTDNYEISYSGPATYNADVVTMTFNIARINSELVVETEYGQNYNTSKIVYLFNNAFMQAIADGKPGYSNIISNGWAPYLDGKPIAVNASDTDLYDGSYPNLKASVVIEVTLKKVKYTLTFDPNNGGIDQPFTANEDYYYGNHVNTVPDESQLTPPVTSNDTVQIFLGWYTTFTLADDTTEYRAWRFNTEGAFDEDRITQNTTLTAEWLDANELVSVRFEVDGDLIAQNTIQSSDITVWATYKGTDIDGNEHTQEVKLAPGKYEILYEDAEGSGNFVKTGMLHVRNSLMGIKVTHTFNHVTKEDIQYLLVDPQEIVLNFNFGDTDGEIFFEYDGNVKQVRQITDDEIKQQTNRKLISTTYSYYDDIDMKPITAADLKEVGHYTVTINYVAANADYYAKATVLRVYIDSKIDVYIQWSTNSLMYSGAAQHPEPKVYNSQTNQEVLDAINIVYAQTNGLTAKDVKNGYIIKIDSVGSKYKIVSGDEWTFDIVKAELNLPVFDGGIEYDGTLKNVEDYIDGFNPLLMEIVSGGTGTDAGSYFATLKLKDTKNCSWADGSVNTRTVNWKIDQANLIPTWDKWEFISDGENAFAPRISSLIGLASKDSAAVDLNSDITYKLYDEDGNLLDVSEVDEVGAYKIVASINASASWASNYVLDSNSKEWYFVVVPKSGMTILTIEWGDTQFTYDGAVHYPTFTVKDGNGKDVTEDVGDLLKFSDGYRKEKELGTYSVKVTLKDAAVDEYFIRSGATCKYKIVDENGYAPDEEETANRTNSGDAPKPGGGFDIAAVGEFLKQWWQVIVSGVSILLIIIFTGKGISYASKRKENKRTTESRYNTYYAALWIEGTGLFSLPYKTWTIIAFALAGTAVLSLIFMLMQKKSYKKSQQELEYARVDYERDREDNAYRRREEDNMRRDDEYRRQNEEMRMMFMNMMGAAGAGAGAQPQYASMGGTNITVDADHIKGIITETVAALLPGMQAMLPQQAGSNDEMVKMLADNMAEERRRSDEERRKSDETIQRLLDKSQKSDERMAQLMEKILEKETAPATVIDNSNSEAMAQMLKNQEELIKQLLDKEPATVTVDKSNDEAYERMLKSQEELIHKLLDKEPAPVEDEEEEPQTKKGKKKSKKAQAEEVADDNSEQMEQLARNQELLMQQLQELANKEPQVVEVEKIIDNTDNETLDQLVRQINELAAHANKEPKVVEKIVEVPVEKVVEKIVEKKVPVEKVVEKIVKVPAEKKGVSATTSTRTPRLNIDEAYAKLSKEQKKYFDKLREYALSKEKSKEKKSTYYILLGQSSVNPLVKLTIKKDTTVALFKMEDEYFKDLRRNADGAKVKVKESELIVADQESFNMAKQMIDLRVDQIDRYQEYLKEQREYNKK